MTETIHETVAAPADDTAEFAMESIRLWNVSASCGGRSANANLNPK